MTNRSLPAAGLSPFAGGGDGGKQGVNMAKKNMTEMKEHGPMHGKMGMLPARMIPMQKKMMPGGKAKMMHKMQKKG